MLSRRLQLVPYFNFETTVPTHRQEFSRVQILCACASNRLSLPKVGNLASWSWRQSTPATWPCLPSCQPEASNGSPNLHTPVSQQHMPACSNSYCKYLWTLLSLEDVGCGITSVYPQKLPDSLAATASKSFLELRISCMHTVMYETEPVPDNNYWIAAMWVAYELATECLW
jgi:hypothetical protein